MTEPSADQVAEYEAAVMAAAVAEAEAASDQVEVVYAVRAAQGTVRQIITDLQAEKERAQTVLDKSNSEIGPGDTKTAARAARRIADATIDLARVIRDMSRIPDDPVPPV